MGELQVSGHRILLVQLTRKLAGGLKRPLKLSELRGQSYLRNTLQH